jgi:hypothetical protein
MRKRFALTIAAIAVFAMPAAGALASDFNADGVLPDEACHAVYPAPVQSALCGRGQG